MLYKNLPLLYKSVLLRQYLDSAKFKYKVLLREITCIYMSVR